MFSSRAGKLAQILKILRQAGGALRAQMVYQLKERRVGLFICENPLEAALALKAGKVAVETDTVLTVLMKNRPGTLSFLVQSLEAEKIAIGYTYSTSLADRLLVIFRTDDNPKAEDALRRYLHLEDEEDAAPWVQVRRKK
ncbi:MAG: hypothetical protein HY717_06815 [Planctomycetes bacterium]|nr:hypothetical protein [Planctomycetota bacterium]